MQTPPLKLVNAVVKLNSLFRIFWIGLASIFVLVGLGIAIFGFVTMIKANESQSWPIVEGVITSSELKSWLDDDGDWMYGANVIYEYMIEEVQLTGRNVKFGKVNTNRSSDAENVLQKYPEGSQVNVFYNPDEFEVSVLEPGVHATTWFMPIFGLVFASIGFVFVLVGIFALKPKFKAVEESYKSVREF